MRPDKRTRPDITPVSKYPDLEKPGIHALMQLLKLSLMTTRGDIIFRGASYVQRLAAGTEGQVPHYDANGEPVPGDIGDISGVLPATKVEVAELGTAYYDDVQDYINFFGNRTILSGGALTDNGDGTVAMASCKAWCKESDSDTAVGKFFDFDGAVSIALTDLTANIIYLDYNKTNGSATPQVVVATAPATHGFKQDHILVGVVYLDGTDAHVVQADFLGIQIANRTHMHEVEHHGPHRSSGAVTSATGTRNLIITAGVFYYGLNRKTILPFNTSRTGTADQDEANKLHDADADFAATDVGKDAHNVTDDTYGEITAFVNSGELTLAADTFPDGNEVHNVDWFSYWYYDGDASPSAVWVEVKGSTQISNSQYNDVDTGLVNFTANRFGVHWVYMDMDGKHIHIVYGQGDYKVNEAVEATVPSLLPNAVTKFGVLIAKIICQQGTDTLTILYPWTTVFMSTLATDHGSLGGLDGDDHPQYIKDTEFTAAEDILVGTGSGTFNQITLAALQILGKKAAGAVVNVTMAELWAMLSGAPAAAVDMNGQFFSDMPIENGATVPASPRTGEMFLHTPTGRDVLIMYDGSNWIPIISLGTMTMYVDKTDGSDSIDKGTGVDSDAFATVQYAVDQIPGLVDGNVAIYITAEDYGESVTIRGKKYTGDYTITLQGVLSSQETATADSMVQGTGATQGSLTDTGAFTGNSYANMLLHVATLDEYRLIDSHTNDVLTIVGAFSGSGAYVWTVYDWGTTLYKITVAEAQIGVRVNDIRCTNYYGFWVRENSEAIFTRCKADDSFYCTRGVGELNECYGTNTSTHRAVQSARMGEVTVYRSKFYQASANANCARCNDSGILSLAKGTILECASATGTNGLYAYTGAIVFMYSAASDGYCRVRGCAIGVKARTGAQVGNTTNVQYSGNTVDEEDSTAQSAHIS